MRSESDRKRLVAERLAAELTNIVLAAGGAHLGGAGITDM
jgi:hypothetical protein